MAREITSRLIAERGFHLVRNAPEINQPVYVVAQMTETAEKARTRSGASATIFAVSAEVDAETRGFSRRTRGGLTA